MVHASKSHLIDERCVDYVVVNVGVNVDELNLTSAASSALLIFNTFNIVNIFEVFNIFDLTLLALST